MDSSLLQLLPNWNSENSSLSRQSKLSSRVSILRHHGKKVSALKSFDINVDDVFTYYASELLTPQRDPCAWVLLKIAPDRYAGVWLYQMAGTDLPLESVAYALSTWYHDSYKTTGPRPVVAYFTSSLEIRTSEKWHTLYAKHPLLRVCRGVVTFSRSKKTNIEWSGGGVPELLLALYKTVRKQPGNKVPLQPIRMKH